MKHREPALFGSLAVLMDIGMSLPRSLGRLADTAPCAEQRRVLRDLQTDLESGTTLLESAERQAFSDRQLGWLAIAEATGDVEEVLPHLIRYQWMSSAALWRIAAGSLYVLTILALLTLAYSPWACAALLGALALGAWSVRRFGLQRWLLRLPGIGPVLRESVIAEFSRALAVQLRRGIPLGQALRRAGRVLGTPYGQALGHKAADALVQEGELTPSLRRTGLFSRDYLSFVRCGEETGALAQIMGDLADRSEARLERAQHALMASSRGLSLAGMAIMLTALLVVPHVAAGRLTVHAHAQQAAVVALR